MDRNRVGGPGLATAVAILAPLAACGGDGGPAGPDGADASLALSVAGDGPAPASARSPSRSVEQTDGQGNRLVLDSVQVVLREIELERLEDECPDDGAGADDDADDDCEEFDAGIRLLDVPLDGSVDQVVSVQAPADTYDELEFEIHKPDDDDPDGRAFIQDHPNFEDVSIRVKGTFNDDPFLFLQDLDEEQERPLDPPLTVASGTTVNLTLRLDVRTWFARVDGSLVDPATANHGGPNEDLVEENIEASIEVFEDDDRDGEHDD